MRRQRRLIASLAVIGIIGLSSQAGSQPYDGPFAPHRGAVITTNFANEFGKDAASTTRILVLTPQVISLEYWSSRGITVRRDILVGDRQTASTYVLGFSPKMPTVIPGSTSTGISGAVLSQLRSTGQAPLTLIYSEGLDRIPCALRLVGAEFKTPVIVEDRIFELPAIRASAECAAGDRRGVGDFIFASDVNNPIMIESRIKFSWEKQPRTERVTRVAAGYGMHSEMEQSLNTYGTYDVYGLHFDFDSTSLRPDTAQLVREIAAMLKNNSTWRLQIAGHTDSTGGADYNLRLSTQRAAAVVEALVNQGIAPDRLSSIGYGESKPKGDNGTLEGRAINRRVEFRRLDR